MRWVARRLWAARALPGVPRLALHEIDAESALRDALADFYAGDGGDLLLVDADARATGWRAVRHARYLVDALAADPGVGESKVDAAPGKRVLLLVHAKRASPETAAIIRPRGPAIRACVFEKRKTHGNRFPSSRQKSSSHLTLSLSTPRYPSCTQHPGIFVIDLTLNPAERRRRR